MESRISKPVACVEIPLEAELARDHNEIMRDWHRQFLSAVGEISFLSLPVRLTVRRFATGRKRALMSSKSVALNTGC